MILSIFSYAFFLVICLSLEKCLFRSSYFFDWVCGVFFDVKLYEIFVYFGDLSPCWSLICRDFLPFCGLSFHFFFLTVSFVVEKPLSLIRSHLFIFVFIFITHGGRAPPNCCNICQNVFCLYFPLRVLYYLTLHFGL